MKRIFCSLILWGVVALMSVAAPKLKFYDAQQFTLVGKLMPGTFTPYHRIDTVKYKGFDKKELLQVRESAGMSIAFKTSSRTIAVKCEFGDVEWPQNSTGIAAHGFDLYIKKDGAWRWAGSGARSQETLNKALIEDGGYKPRVAFGPVRVAMSGRRVSPPLFESMEIVGKPLTMQRLEGLRAHLGEIQGA